MLDFDSTDNKLHSINDETGDDEGTFCEGFFVSKVYSDLITGDETVEMKLFPASGKKTLLLEASKLTISQLPSQLLSKGITFLNNLDTAEMVTAYAIDSKRSAPVFHLYSSYGWFKKGKKCCYLASNLVMSDKVSAKIFHSESEKLSPAGTFDAWKDGIMPFLYRPEVVLALVIGASATVVPLLKEAGVFPDTMIFAIIGNSSTYKTSIMKLMASIYGKPEIGSGVIDTMLDTNGYFFENLGRKYGFLHCIDDISAASKHDFTNDLYNISMCKSRGRLTPDGKPRKIHTWCTTVVYTGETSIFAQTNNNGGLYARLIELSGITWLSPDDDDINAFFDTINENYGVAIIPLVQKLMKCSHDDIRNLYNDCFDIVVKKIPAKNGITRRIIQRFAILLTSLCICNEAWGVEFQIPPVLELLEMVYDLNYASYDPIEIAIESMKAEILNKNNFFLKDSEYRDSSPRAWGIYGTYNDIKCLWIVEDKMQEIAGCAGIISLKGVQKALADRGFLVRDKSNHYRFDKIICGVEVKCFGVYLHAKSREIKSKIAKNKKFENRKKINITKSPQLQDMLSDDDEEEI